MSNKRKASKSSYVRAAKKQKKYEDQFFDMMAGHETNNSQPAKNNKHSYAGSSHGYSSRMQKEEYDEEYSE